MEKYIPYEKLSKKKQRELNAKRRGSWGNISPVTRRTENPKAYNRAKARRSDFSKLPDVLSFLLSSYPVA